MSSPEPTVNTWEAIGYVASMLVLTAFGMKSMIPLRVVAMCSNLVFIVYGLGLGLTPIWSLHAALLPMNAWRLVEALGGAQAVGALVLRQAADDDSIVGGRVIPWLRNRAGQKIESFHSLLLNTVAPLLVRRNTGNASSLPTRSPVRTMAAPPLRYQE
jgi:hypothetical protein